MILKNRLFVRRPPDRDAKTIYIFCEGAKREYQYFTYFQELDSRINIQIYKLQPDEDNSPRGLLQIALDCLILDESNEHPKFNFLPNDEVWFVFDSDDDATHSRLPQIQELRKECNTRQGWNTAQSNPCFEVWLYSHFCSIKPNINECDVCKKWKKGLNKMVNGGFDSRRHPVFIGDASIISANNFEEEQGTPNFGSTEVYRLADSILTLIEAKLKKGLSEINE